MRHVLGQVFIGEQTTTTSTNKVKMHFQKTWRSSHIRSWSGGQKLADIPGRSPELVDCKFSEVMRHQVIPKILCADSSLHVLHAQHENHSTFLCNYFTLHYVTLHYITFFTLTYSTAKAVQWLESQKETSGYIFDGTCRGPYWSSCGPHVASQKLYSIALMSSGGIATLSGLRLRLH